MTSLRKTVLLMLIVAGAFTCLIKPAQAVTYEYDQWNRLWHVILDDETVITYQYDENGNRTEETFNGFSITVTSGAGGSVSPSSINIPSGDSQTFSIIPATGHTIVDVKVDGNSVGAVSSYAFTNVTASHTLQAIFAANTFTITASVAGGSGGTISPTSATVDYGGSQTFTMTPNAGYHVAGVLVDGSSAGAVTSYTFSNVTANHTIQVSFAINTYTITPSVLDGYGGTISPASATVNYGGSQTFTFTPDATFSIADVRVDGVSQGAITTYTFSNVTAAHTLQVAFNYSTNPVKNQRTGQLYSSLQTAYAAAATGDVLLCRNFRLVESFTANSTSNISVTIRGGCNADFTVGSGKTVLIGAASIQNGTVVWENSLIRGSVF